METLVSDKLLPKERTLLLRIYSLTKGNLLYNPSILCFHNQLIAEAQWKAKI